jgi:hypothetical protein
MMRPKSGVTRSGQTEQSRPEEFRPMPDPAPRLRHAPLFELLRQKSMAEMTAHRLAALSAPQIDPDDAAMIKALAARSWMAPGHRAVSGPKPGRYNKFFGTVRS